MTDIVTVVGARPQFIKAAMVSRSLQQSGLNEKLVHTGQHYDQNMSGVFFRELGMSPPDVNLEVGSGSHAEQTGAMMIRLEEELLAHPSPDCVLVYGDTNSTIAAAVTARKLHIPVAHVEAGLRSFNRYMPEELNRIVTDRLSDHLFCPTQTAVHNLEIEGIRTGVFLTGDVMYDATRHYSAQLSSLDYTVPESPYCVATVHRAENTDDPARLGGIIRGFGRLGTPVVFLVHPRTHIRLHGLALPDNIVIKSPQSYLKTMTLVKCAHRVLTDSGGLQKESIWLETPCVTLRDETEWAETLGGNWNILTGSDPERIEEAVETEPDGPPPVFGRIDGISASDRIAAILKDV